MSSDSFIMKLQDQSGDEKDKKLKSCSPDRYRPKECEADSVGNRQHDGDHRKRRREKQVKIADQIEYKNGTLMTAFKDHELPGEKIDQYTAQKLQNCSEKLSHLKRGRAGASAIFRTM